MQSIAPQSPAPKIPSVGNSIKGFTSRGFPAEMQGFCKTRAKGKRLRKLESREDAVQSVDRPWRVFMCLFSLLPCKKLFVFNARISSGNSCLWHLLLAWHRAGGRLSLCGLSTATRALSNGRPVLCSEAGREEVATPTRKGPAADPGSGHGLAFLLHSCPSPGATGHFQDVPVVLPGPRETRSFVVSSYFKIKPFLSFLRG